MIEKAICKHCRKELRINGFYNMERLKREHLQSHSPEWIAYCNRYKEIRKLEIQINELVEKQNSDNYKDIS